ARDERLCFSSGTLTNSRTQNPGKKCSPGAICVAHAKLHERGPNATDGRPCHLQLCAYFACRLARASRSDENAKPHAFITQVCLVHAVGFLPRAPGCTSAADRQILSLEAGTCACSRRRETTSPVLTTISRLPCAKRGLSLS